MDGFTAGYYHSQQQDYTDAAPQNHQQYTDVAGSQDYQLPNSRAPVPVVSGGHVMDLGVSSYFMTPSSRFLEDLDPEEASGYIGKYTCPYLDCPFSNYSHGFNSRAKRNSHMAVCLYGNGVVYHHVPADGQMPSAPYINATVEEFMRGIAARNCNKNNNPLTVEPAGLAPLSSLNTTITARPPDSQAAPGIYPQSVEPGIHQLELPTQRNAFENNNNNNGVWSTHYSDKQPLEATTMMTQGGFQQSALVGNNLDGFNLTGTDKSHQNVTFGIMGAAASFSDEDWQLDYPPSTWNC